MDRLEELDPNRCRATVAERYDVDVVTSAYEGAYRWVMAADARERLAGRRAVRPVPDVR